MEHHQKSGSQALSPGPPGSSINPHYTLPYSQPDEYRFSHDSVFLARRVFELEGRNLAGTNVLDVCAGCGIVGLDLIFHAQKELGVGPKQVDFMEIQDVYRPHFEKNAGHLPGANVRFIVGNYTDLYNNTYLNRYDLIVCNPPYFQIGTGHLSPSQFKNRCRFFMDATPEQLIGAVLEALDLNGAAYVLVRDPFKATQWLGKRGRLENVGDVRGTPLVKLTHHSF